jgi:uncharacterized protein
MDWKGGRRSSNIDDQRSAGPAMGGAGGLGLLFRFLPFLLRTKAGRVLLVVGGLGFAAANFLGVDVMKLLGGIQQPAATSASNSQEADLVDFVAVVLADTEDTWKMQFQQLGKNYQEPVLTLFRGSVNSACGLGQAAMGPFYCPGDYKLYIDLSFYQELKNKLGAPGDFAQAYVIAHEVGHHVQNLLGVSTQVRRAQEKASESEANQLSVKLELQADCYAGLWAHAADKERGVVEIGDIEEALTAAAAVGDDRLQQQATGTVRPESFTHGTSKQRAEWFQRGYKTGDIAECDTFR